MSFRSPWQFSWYVAWVALVRRILRPWGQFENRYIEHLAHRLKGAAGMYGLTRLAELARRLQEMMATGSHDDGRRELVEQLAAVCEEEYVADE